MRLVVGAVIAMGAAVVMGHLAAGGNTNIRSKIDEATAERLTAEAYFGAVKDLEFLDYDSGMSRAFTPPFLVFHGLSKPPAEGSFGYFAVNPWTGDVWNLWGCHRLSTPALRKSQEAIRRRFASSELKQYKRLRRLKPECIVED